MLVKIFQITKKCKKNNKEKNGKYKEDQMKLKKCHIDYHL